MSFSLSGLHVEIGGTGLLILFILQYYSRHPIHCKKKYIAILLVKDCKMPW